MDKVLIAPATLAGVEAEFSQVLRSAGFELTFPKRKAQLVEDELIEELKGVKASLAGSEPYSQRVLKANPQLRAIARVGVGYDAVDLAAATEGGIAVTITPGTNQDAVAEHTFALILALAKSVVPQHLGTCALKWPRQSNLPVRGRTLGIAGLGRIGKSVAIRGAAFGMKLLAYDPYPDAAFASRFGVTFVPFDDLVAQSDILTLHLPATKESKHLMNRDRFARMKSGSFVINTSRGSIINEADLIEALRAKHLAGAGLDVFEAEPPTDSPLFHMDNVVVTPHAAGVDVKSLNDMATSAAEAIASLSRGEWPVEKVVNPDVREKFRW